ncbi:S1C family serine protease [Pseudonocardia oceani]|uniref:Trypsin-like peptidase domain-containing protein n=3 Tax=Pseudonocardia oceani TaxID=2792013 RepID=A0ABS6UBF7_9PSEU|nr:trypsin-like peptidase domain-containing protein [Pseudonocardia oceani]MBW0129577.1 trypsin-like peptidase domain-containing protein [Pseudonocardia oceani]
MTSRRALAVVALAAVLTGCTTPTPADPAPPAPAPTAPTPTGPAGVSTADVVARLAPSVVTVRTEQGAGSGVVYREDVVLTNQHVVGDATDVVIDYADGTSSPGTVLATDRITDLAVVRTERTGLPVPEYRTALPRPGEEVLAIGSPLGFEGSVTSGIVSGLDRQIPGSAAQSRALVDLIQVDAAISPGNSGGALLDATGRVIGINEAYIPPSVGAVSIGFAIPASTAVDIAEQLLADGVAVHPYLGVRLAPLTPELREGLGVAAEGGALVTAVAQGGPAATAGVEPGDVIVELAGTAITSIEDVLGTLRDTEPGREVGVSVVREGTQVDLQLTVGTEPMS